MPELIDALGRFAVPVVLVPVAAWTLLHLPVRRLLRTGLFAHPDARYYGHAAWLVGLPLGIAVAAWIEATGVHPPQFHLAVLPAAVPSSPSLVADAFAWTVHDLLGAGLLLWLSASALLTARLLLGWRLARPLHGTRSAPLWLTALAHRHGAHLGLRRPVRLAVGPDDAVPMTVGLRRPVVVLPAMLLADRRGLVLALTHELVHVVRRDNLVHAFEGLVEALFFWHPGVRRLGRDLPGYRELACDAAVLALHRHDARPYADLLFRFATLNPKPALGRMSMADAPRTLKTRIHAMQTPRIFTSRHRRIGLTFAVALLGLAGLVVACSDLVGPEADALLSPSLQEQAEQDSDVFMVVEEMPELIGGINDLAAQIRYPETAKEQGIEGRVFVQFVVDKSGSVKDAVVVRGIGGGCDEEALRVVQAATFKPGRQRGEPVDVKLSIPVTFRLNPAQDQVPS